MTRGAPARRGPRPFALHLTAARAAWAGPDASREDRQRFVAFVEGVRRYHAHPFRRPVRERPVVWSAGSSRLLDGGQPGGWPVLIVPSMINRSAILDLLPGTSLVDRLAAAGLRALLLDWGEPGPVERRMSLGDQIEQRLGGALGWVRNELNRRPIALGYCMGGTLALGLAAGAGPDLAGLALLAAPFDFHAAGLDGRAFRKIAGEPAALLAGALGALPVDAIQALFAGLDLLEVPRKFARFSALDPDGEMARRFVAVEDWLNDGVPLGAEVARECLIDWYGLNRPARGLWTIGGRAVRPERLELPVLLALPARDRIVPHASAAALALRLPSPPTVITPSGGHIAMMTSRRASSGLYAPLLAWLQEVAAAQKGAC